MQTLEYVHWQDGDAILGYLVDYPDYWTQGDSLNDLKDHLADLFQDITSGELPGIRKVDERSHMMQLAPLLCVHDVQASSRWYQQLLGCTSGHGGDEYERLIAGDRLILQLHKWEVEHDHGPLGDSSVLPYGNGVLLWFELDDFDAAVTRASNMNVEVLKERRWSENANWEYWLRDPEGYNVVLTSPLP